MNTSSCLWTAQANDVSSSVRQPWIKSDTIMPTSKTAENVWQEILITIAKMFGFFNLSSSPQNQANVAFRNNHNHFCHFPPESSQSSARGLMSSRSTQPQSGTGSLQASMRSACLSSSTPIATSTASSVWVAPRWGRHMCTIYNYLDFCINPNLFWKGTHNAEFSENNPPTKPRHQNLNPTGKLCGVGLICLFRAWTYFSHWQKNEFLSWWRHLQGHLSASQRKEFAFWTGPASDGCHKTDAPTPRAGALTASRQSCDW